jgi:hypothetical protein
MRNSAQIRDMADATPRRQQISGHLIGTIARRTSTRVWVDFPGNTGGPMPARSVIPVAELPKPSSFGGPRPEVLLVFEEWRPDRPIILELLAPESRAVHLRRTRKPEAALEGRRCVEARDELVLGCGKASITLRRNGRLVLRGTNIVSDATGVNRVRGALVRVE